MQHRWLRFFVLGVVFGLAGCGMGVERRAVSSASTSPRAVASDARPSAMSASPSAAVSAGASAGATAAPSTQPSLEAAESATASSANAAAGAFDPQRVTVGLELVGEGFNQPVYVTNAADGSGRTFVVERAGRIWTLPDVQPFLDIGERVNVAGIEQGLLGLAFHPRFKENGYFYVYYTAQNGNNTVARYSVTAEGRGDPASEKILISQQDPAGNHNGGMITFGPGGYLYIGLGDGGGADDQYGNGQNRQTFLGKLLRIDVDNGDPYAVPPDNPFLNDGNTKPEIWAYGLRNPWRFSFDRATNDLYIADVGQNQFEWLHVRRASEQGGENYGWPILEGKQCFKAPTCNREGLTIPVLDYSHALGCTVIGGYVYRGQQYPALQGAYIFGDYCSGKLWTATQDNTGNWAMYDAMETKLRISSFGEDEAGEVYLADFESGRVFRVTGQPR